MEAGPTFQSEHAKNPAFALVSSMDGSSPPRMDRLWFALAAMAGMLALYITELVDLFVAAVLASAVMLLSKCLSVAEARQSVKWDVIIAIASAFGVSAGLENSGVARQIADTLGASWFWRLRWHNRQCERATASNSLRFSPLAVSLGKAIGGGGLAVQAALYLATALLSNVIANNAAAALMFPIAVEASKLEDMDLKTTLMLIMVNSP